MAGKKPSFYQHMLTTLNTVDINTLEKTLERPDLNLPAKVHLHEKLLDQIVTNSTGAIPHIERAEKLLENMDRLFMLDRSRARANGSCFQWFLTFLQSFISEQIDLITQFEKRPQTSPERLQAHLSALSKLAGCLPDDRLQRLSRLQSKTNKPLNDAHTILKHRVSIMQALVKKYPSLAPTQKTQASTPPSSPATVRSK